MTSPYNIKYWIDKGFSEPQARIEIAKRRLFFIGRIKDIQRKNQKSK